MIFFSKDLSLLPETRQVMEHFKLVFGSGNSSPAKIRPLKNWPPPFPGSHRLLGTSIQRGRFSGVSFLGVMAGFHSG